MSKNLITKNSYTLLIGRTLFRLGACYRSDMLLFLRSTNGDNRSYASKLINEMSKKNLIIEREITKRNKKDKTLEKFITLTTKGKNEIIDYLYLNNHPDMRYFCDNANFFDLDFHTNDIQKLNKNLEDNTIKILFASCNIPVFTNSKPNLYELYVWLQSGKRDTNNNFTDLLNTGIYYSIDEIRQFADSASLDSSDKIFGTRAKGVFLSWNKLLVVYIGLHTNNRLMKILYNSEQCLLEALNPLADLLNVNRKLDDFNILRVTSSGYTTEPKYNSIHAIIISDGTSMVYTTAIGRAKGQIKDIKKFDVSKIQKSKHNFLFLASNNPLYERVFITPTTLEGISSLNYLLRHTPESWKKDGEIIMSNIPNFERNTSINPYYTYQERDAKGMLHPAIFMPVYEINELYRISMFDHACVIVTYPDMVDAISHSVRKECKMYDADTHKPYTDSDFIIYDQKGHPSGLKKIQDILAKQSKKFSVKEFNNLYAQFDCINYIEFYNKIHKGIIAENEIIEKLTLEEKKATVKHRRKPKKAIEVGEDLHEMIKKGAKFNNINVTSYVRKLLKNNEMLKKDAKAYEEKTSDRSGWKTSGYDDSAK